MTFTKLIDYSHLNQQCPDGTDGRPYPTREVGVGYFNQRFIYLRKEGIVLDKVTGDEMSQTRFAKECFNGWKFQSTRQKEKKNSDGSTSITSEHTYGSIVKSHIDDPNRQYLSKKVYEPGKHQEEIPECWNCWPGWPYEPVEGEVTLLHAVLDHLFDGLPHWEREWFEHWVAYQIQNPGEKIFSSVLMSGPSGIGKGTFLRVLETLFGENTHGITEQELVSRFTSSVINKQLVIADEIGVKGEDKHQVARRLKGWITEPKMSVEKKFRDVVEIENRCNFIFATNDPSPLVQDDDDRRYFDLRLTQKVTIDAAPKENGLAVEFFDWFGASNVTPSASQIQARQAVMHYFLHLDIGELRSDDTPAHVGRFNPKGSAPETSSKAGFIELSSSEAMNWLRTLRDSPDDALSFGENILPNVLLSTEDIFSLFQYFTMSDTKKKAYEQELARSNFFELAHGGSGGRVRTSTGTKRLWVIRPHLFVEERNNLEAIRALYDFHQPRIAEFLDDQNSQQTREVR